MRHLLGGLLLATAFSAQAADIGVSLGGSLKHYDDTYGDMSTGPDRLNVHARFADHWQVGVEALHRKGEYRFPDSVPAAYSSYMTASPDNIQTTTALSYGVEAKYLQRLGSRHLLGVAVSGGYGHYEQSNPAIHDLSGPAIYYAFSFSYDYQLTPQFSLGLAWRQQVDRVDEAEPPAGSLCNLNCSGLSNIVYNPYGGPASFDLKDRSLALMLGYDF